MTFPTAKGKSPDEEREKGRQKCGGRECVVVPNFMDNGLGTTATTEGRMVVAGGGSVQGKGLGE